MKAYFYLAMALNAGMVAELKPQLDAMLSTYSNDLSLKSPHSGVPPSVFDGDRHATSSAQETGFGEMHFLIGQRAILNGNLGSAYRELSRANELLPDSASISLVLATVTMSYARYADALAAFERVLSAGPDDSALLGRARALSYLRRHDEAIAVLEESLKNVAEQSRREVLLARVESSAAGAVATRSGRCDSGVECDEKQPGLQPRGDGGVQPEPPCRIA